MGVSDLDDERLQSNCQADNVDGWRQPGRRSTRAAEFSALHADFY